MHLVFRMSIKRVTYAAAQVKATRKKDISMKKQKKSHFSSEGNIIESLITTREHSVTCVHPPPSPRNVIRNIDQVRKCRGEFVQWFKTEGEGGSAQSNRKKNRLLSTLMHRVGSILTSNFSYLCSSSSLLFCFLPVPRLHELILLLKFISYRSINS